MNQQLKQRLVGAVVLVSLAVIFIPIILEGPDVEWSPRTQGMPEPPEIAYHAEGETELPLTMEEPQEEAIPAADESTTAAPAPLDKEVAAVAPPTQEPRPAAKPDATPPQPVVAPQPESQPVPAQKQPTTAAATGGWAIQVGRFTQQQNAQGLRDRLRKAGYAAFLQEAGSNGETSWRVLVGPLKTRSDAESIRDELASKRQLKGFVIQNNG